MHPALEQALRERLAVERFHRPVPIFTIHWLWASEDSFQMLNHLSGAVFSATFGLAVLFGGT
jgi:hypothetical protein